MAKLILTCPSLGASEVALIRAGMQEIEDNTCVAFRPHHDERNYLFIRSPMDGGEACAAYRGMIDWGISIVNLHTPSCIHTSIIAHELLHIVGLGHEQQHPDRESYLNVYRGNVVDSEFVAALVTPMR